MIEGWRTQKVSRVDEKVLRKMSVPKWMVGGVEEISKATVVGHTGLGGVIRKIRNLRTHQTWHHESQGEPSTMKILRYI